MGDCSTNCNPCGPSYDAINQLAVQTKSYARQALSAVTTVEEFQSLYLGAKATAPTTDNEGNPLQVGALYFNTNDGEMYVWAGSAWEFWGQGALPASNFGNVWSYTGNGTQTVFAITGGLSILAPAYLVTIDGIVQKTTNYTINNVTPRTLTMSQAVPNGSEINIVSLSVA